MENKNFVAIGKIMIDTLGTDWNIPNLYFIVNKTPSNLYEATNFEMILDASGSTIEEAINQLSSLTFHYVYTVMSKGRGYDEFIENVNSRIMEDYWQEYRNIEFNLARHKKDLSHELSNKINAFIKSMLSEEIIRHIKEKAANIVTFIINNIDVKIFTTEEVTDGKAG